MIKIKQGSSSTDEHTSGNPYMDFEAAQNGQIEVLSNDVSCPAPMTITIDGEDVEYPAANVIPTTDAGTYSLSRINGNTVVQNDNLISFLGQALKTTDSNDDVVDTLDINITTLKGTRADGTHEVMFPEGLKKAGNVYDEINYKTGKAIKRIASVDLGTTDFTNHVTLQNVFNLRNVSPAWKVVPVGQTVPALCAKYTIVTSGTGGVDAVDKSLALGTQGSVIIYIHDSSYTDAAALKSALSGVMLYYELATPIEYTIDGFIQEPKRVLANTTDVQDVKEVYAGQDPVWYAYYGWDYNSSTHAMTRIGNTTWHKTLPIQSKMRRCAVTDNGTVKYISTWDYTKYEDGTTVDYTGGDGQIMVEIPEYYYEAYEETRDGVVHKILKLYPYAKIGKKSKKFYSSAFEGVTDDASNSTDPKLYSISMLKGGTKDNDGNYLADQWLYEDNAADYAGSGGDSNASSLKSNFSRPRSYLSETAFRTRATRRGIGWSQKYFTAYNSILRLYTVEYNSLNSQDTFYATLDANEHFRGGLGKGVTDTSGDAANNTYWNNFNGRYPFIPCGVTKELGSNTGVVGVKYTANGPSASGVYTTRVPSYRGIENPFGHLWEWTDGYTKYGTGSTGNIYTCDDITKFSDSLTDANVPDGYVLRGTCSLTNDWFGDWVWDSNGEFVHKTFASSESDSPFHDYAYHNNTGNRALISGGGADYGSRAGLFCWRANNAPSYVSASIGGRLYYTPSEN